jgi:ribonuclease G
MSDFGLIQITRQRLRPSITTTFSAPGSTMNGTPDEPAKATARTAEKPRADRIARAPAVQEPLQSAAELVLEMEQWLVDYKVQGNRRSVTLRVHPFTAAYLNRRLPTYPTRWFMKHLVRVRMEPDESLAPMAYRFLDSKSGDDVTRNVVEAAEKIRGQ